LRELVKRIVCVLLDYIVQVIGLRSAVPGIVVGVSSAVQGHRSRLVQHVQQLGQRIIAIRRIHAVRPVQARASAARVIGEADRNFIGIGDPGEAVSKIVSERGAVLEGVDHGGTVAAQIVFIAGGVRLRVGNGLNQSGGIVSQRCDVVEWIGDLR